MSPDLVYSINSLKSKSQNYLRFISIASQEIKDLETELQTLSIGLCAKVISSEEDLNQREKDEFKIQDVGEWKFLRAFAEESLIWGRDVSSGKYRLLYCRTIMEERVNNDTDFSQNTYASNKYPDGISEMRPLIETPVDVRVRCHSRLKQLVKNIELQIDELIKSYPITTLENLI